MNSTSRQARGYILVETIVAMAILAVSSITLQRAVQTSIQARGLAQDMVTVRFLMNELLAEIELQEALEEQEHQGNFPGKNDRFFYEWSIQRVPVPVPEIPPGTEQAIIDQINTQFKKYMGRLKVRIYWSRAGFPMDIQAETLISPEKMWIPPSDRLEPFYG